MARQREAEAHRDGAQAARERIQAEREMEQALVEQEVQRGSRMPISRATAIRAITHTTMPGPLEARTSSRCTSTSSSTIPRRTRTDEHEQAGQ